MGTIFNYAGLSRLSQDDLRALERAAAIIDIPINWLGAVMQYESGFNPAAKNPLSGASGLIQFMPGEHGSAAVLKTSTDALRAMSFQEQLPYVIRYFGEKARIPTLETAYLRVFYPAAIGKPMDWVVAKEGTKVFSQNQGFFSGKTDSEGNKYIDVSDITSVIRNVYNKGKARGEIAISPLP